MNPFEITLTIRFKENTNVQWADQISKKMIRALDIDELCVIEGCKLQQVMAEFTVSDNVTSGELGHFKDGV